MKNREKFEKEILEIACSGQSLAVHKNTGVLHGCGALNCNQCLFSCRFGEDCSHNCQKWCEAEYGEPYIDWNKVSVDTPVLVRNTEDCLWSKKYFAKYENGIVYTWMDGRTSWSAMYPNDIAAWKYAKLTETKK